MSAGLRLITGILLLLFGRNLFWLFCAAIGFLVGAALAARALPGQPEWVMLVVGLAVGLVGALLALVLPNVIGMIAGFAAGGYLALTLIEAVGARPGELAWLAFLIGGAVGAIAVLLLFDWALIGLSSLMGSFTIVNGLPLHGTLVILLTGLLFVVGVAVQAGLWKSRQRREIAT
jgi:hypothetical protein